MNWWNQPGLCHKDALVCDGSIRAGKTLAMTCGFFLWSMSRFDNQTFALCGKTVGALRRNVILQLGDWLGGLFSITENRGDNRLTVQLGSRKNTYYLFGGQDESAYTLVQGITLAGALLDETALMPRSFVEQVCARCSVPGSKMWFSCNPASSQHWFYKEWICKQTEKNILYLHFTMNDNPGLSEQVRSRYERMFSGVFYKRYIQGLWCTAEGLIYHFDPEKHLVQPPKEGRWYISVDYGTCNPFSAGLWCVSGGKAVRVKEFYHDGRSTGKTYTDTEYYDALVELAGDRPVECVIVDPSAASFLAVLRKQGRFRVRKARNQVLPGIRLVTELLQQGKLGFCPACKDTIREFGLYCWSDDPTKDTPVKENDHAMDDVRYFCMTVMSRG